MPGIAHPLASVRAKWAAFVGWLPRGSRLDEATWRSRHTVLSWVTAAHIPLLALVGLVRGVEPFAHILGELTIVAGLLLAARLTSIRAVKAMITAVALVSCAALLVHFTGGLIESHFHFFVVTPLVSLYRDWRPLSAGLLYVIVHHGLFGVLSPEDVYNHPAAIANPILWAVIHGGYVLMLTAVLLAYWGFSERTEGALMREERLRRIAEEQRHAAETQRLEHLVHSKDQFIASVSHELRTPLTAVVGFAELLANEEAGLTAEDRSDLVTTIVREASDLSAIVEDLLVAARSELGTIRVTAAPVDVNATVDLVVRALPTGHRSRISVKSGPSTWALGDPARLRQIVRNLVSNAIRYGGPNIEVELDHDQVTTTVRVIDDGPGIPDADRDRIFLPYEVTGEATTLPASVGLGLTVSRDLAERMGGSLTYDHSVGRSVFEVRLPRIGSHLVTAAALDA